MPTEPKQRKWYEQKTTWSAVLMIATAIMPLFGNLIAPEQIEGVRTVILGLAVIFMRQGIENVKKEIRHA